MIININNVNHSFLSPRCYSNVNRCYILIFHMTTLMSNTCWQHSKQKSPSIGADTTTGGIGVLHQINICLCNFINISNLAQCSMIFHCIRRPIRSPEGRFDRTRTHEVDAQWLQIQGQTAGHAVQSSGISCHQRPVRKWLFRDGPGRQDNRGLESQLQESRRQFSQ